MLTQPVELTDAALAAVLAEHWHLAIDQIEYRAVGFGSHHWSAVGGAGRWFVTVDDLDTKLRADRDTRERAFARLSAALDTARQLHAHGLSFVVAPIPDALGDVVRQIDDRFVVAVYPHVDGIARPWGRYDSNDDRVAALEMLVAIHDAPVTASPAADFDDFTIQNRDNLEHALATSRSAWRTGPYGEHAWQLIARHRDAILRLLDQHDRLATDAVRRPDRRVVTHGEPHIGNTMVTNKGWVLVDWDTVLVAPPERDLWMVSRDDPEIDDLYTTLTGRDVVPSNLELYRITWDLADMGVYAALFRRPHADTDDLRQSMSNLTGLLELSASSPA